MRSPTGSAPTERLSRFEYKYLVSEPLARQLRARIQPFTRPDPHAHSPGGEYTITSLYLDSLDLQLLEMGLTGQADRFKLRVRTYSPDCTAPAFLEVKRRVNGIVHKTRTRVGGPAARALLRAGTRPRDASSAPGLVEFERRVLALRARSTLNVRYRREAHVGRGPDSVRVTFDRALECADGRRGELSPPPSAWRPVPLGGVVLEIKFTGAFPAWLAGLARALDLERRSISKYSQALLRAAPAGFPLPGTLVAQRRDPL
jgi:hypothetical protein